MKALDTKTIINLLPFSNEKKLDLLEKFDSLSRDEQLKISDVVWEAYYSFYDLKIKENFDKAIREADKNSQEPSENLYTSVVEKTDQEMKNMITSLAENIDLASARRSMELIIKEINAAKIPSKP
jgi:hypothetical protein